MQMYFEITDAKSVAKLDKALEPINTFDSKLHALQKKYGADTPYVFNSLDRGLEFGYFWFEKYPLHLDTEKEFKVSSEKYKTGYELRPRKSNRKFYSEFMEGLEGVNYNSLKAVLFNNEKCRPSISYTKKDNAYYIDSTVSIVLPHKELTASQYNNLISVEDEAND
ncbi:hypothetical protein [Acinetobacter schindleri]|uniref:hypothetical protein n=1 Tax=Acinetobacter schindleri TaxID=108981 RepID=UPI00161CF313|nr:hypothetical protein [Acinetobacter schindleri]MBB4836884.1 hypothetical protein [Acinetobacter schindleri]WBX36809.1 hypothetical protein MYA84_08690 [Acinetobacter schindleri]